jgi:hypothetical protein
MKKEKKEKKNKKNKKNKKKKKNSFIIDLIHFLIPLTFYRVM